MNTGDLVPGSTYPRDVHLGRNGRHLECTHVTSAHERSFDHILASHHFAAQQVGYQHGWRLDGLSDHFAVRASVELR